MLGSDARSPFSSSNNAKLFMNFGAPAQCSGTVTSWHYCSYNSFQGDGGESNEDSGSDDNGNEDSESDDRGGCQGSQNYTSVFLVYRRNPTSDIYQVVPGSRKSITLMLDCRNRGGFQCDRTATLTSDEQFIIQENDIVAACLKDTGSTDPIQLVGEESSALSGNVYWYDGNNYDECTSSQLQTIDTQNSAFTIGGGVYRLHLYAETNSKQTI